jgi:Flp pilus assembly pilin Flp
MDWNSRPQRIAGEAGATAVEYALLVSLVAGVILVAVVTLGVKVGGLYGDTCAGVANAMDGSSC